MPDPRPDPFDCPRGIDAGAYVLKALDEGERAAYGAHLGECAHCREEVQALRLVVDTLPLAAPQDVPGPALKGRIMAVVNAEAELLRAAGPEADRAVAAAPRRRRWLPDGFGLRPAFVGALACGLLAVGVVGGLAADLGEPESRNVNATAPVGARAALTLTGDSASLQVRDMPSPPKGQVYQVWLETPDGQLHPTHSLFNVRSDGRANVAIEESVKGIQRVLVTAEPSGGNLAPSSAPVIAAKLA
jgi:hypothetical protein